MDREQPKSDDEAESPADRKRRLELEARLIAEARAEAAAGLTISLEAIWAWVDSWDTENELPPPEPGQ
jgi:predicted transcriptional regulator